MKKDHFEKSIEMYLHKQENQKMLFLQRNRLNYRSIQTLQIQFYSHFVFVNKSFVHLFAQYLNKPKFNNPKRIQ